MEDILENQRPPFMDLSGPGPSRIARHRSLLLASGLACLFLGTFGLAIEFLVKPVNLLHAGLLLLMGGSALLLPGFPEKERPGNALPAIACCYLAAGLTILCSPLAESRMAVFFFSASLLGIGAGRLFPDRRYREKLSLTWTTSTGIITGLLAISIAAGWPEARLKLIAPVIPVELIISGWTCLLLARPGILSGKAGRDAA